MVKVIYFVSGPIRIDVFEFSSMQLESESCYNVIESILNLFLKCKFGFFFEM